jgi:hypothetical protein
MEVTMKYLYLVILLFLLTVEISAQNLSDSSELSVLQKKWSIKLVYSPNSILNEDPLRYARETSRAILESREAASQRSISNLKNTPPAVASSTRFLRSGTISENISLVSYRYQLKVRNNGIKTIQSITWDYIFLDSVTHQQVGQRQVISKTNLKPNKIVNLAMHSRLSPTGVNYSAHERRKLHNRFIEQVNIKSIEYTDGTVWRASSK